MVSNSPEHAGQSAPDAVSRRSICELIGLVCARCRRGSARKRVGLQNTPLALCRRQSAQAGNALLLYKQSVIY